MSLDSKALAGMRLGLAIGLSWALGIRSTWWGRKVSESSENYLGDGTGSVVRCIKTIVKNKNLDPKENPMAANVTTSNRFLIGLYLVAVVLSSALLLKLIMWLDGVK